MSPDRDPPQDGPDLDAAWAAALAGALIGADRAPQAASGEAGPGAADGLGLPVSGDAGADLLARLGALAAWRSAGAGLAAGRLAPFPPLDPPGPDCPAAAGGRLALLLTEGGSAAEPLVEEWCGLAAERGFRAPPELWPLLDLRAATAAGAASMGPVAGAEVAWLRRAVAGEPDAPGGGAAGDAGDWTLGALPERRRLFAAMRAADPDAARDALAAAFRSEKAEARAALVEAMGEGLGGADEFFLEACLDDRSATVRGAAQRLLLRLPDSRLAGRMAERAGAALRVTTERRLLGAPRHALEVALPEPSPELARDGIEPRGGAAAGTGAGLLRELVGCAPLRAYAAHPPALWLSLAAESDWRKQLLPGFVEAARRERDPGWTEAALVALGRICAERTATGARDQTALSAYRGLMSALPAEDWEKQAGAALQFEDVEFALNMVETGARPHSPGFTHSVLVWMSGIVRRGGPDRDVLRNSTTLRALSYRLDPGTATAPAARLLDLVPEEVDVPLHRSLAILADTLAQRAAMRREFDA